ncbi:MAG: epoxide hydrolase [Akkermansiaceae bacterium]|nr:epoxide hydrolase [Akkermansiaceae bacterium]
MNHRFVETATIRMQVREQGEGPLVLLCHGFPETSHAWRHQLPALAAAGFRAVAPDLRGYGQSDSPEPVDGFTVFHLVGDMVALLDALGERTAVIVGNDWGATIAWQAAQMRPDRFRGVVALGVPMMGRPPLPPTRLFPQTADELFYVLYFQEPGLAEKELEADVRTTLRKILHAASGEAGPRRSGDATPNPFGMVSRQGGLLPPLPDPGVMPAWLPEADLDEMVKSFEKSGFRGGLNYYRNLDRNWQLQASLAGAAVEVPALFMAGERDAGLAMPGMREMIAEMGALVPKLAGSLIVPGSGHWVPQERPDAVSQSIISFLGSLR